jgi:hypothetical protein
VEQNHPIFHVSNLPKGRVSKYLSDDLPEFLVDGKLSIKPIDILDIVWWI